MNRETEDQMWLRRAAMIRQWQAQRAATTALHMMEMATR